MQGHSYKRGRERERERERKPNGSDVSEMLEACPTVDLQSGADAEQNECRISGDEINGAVCRVGSGKAHLQEKTGSASASLPPYFISEQQWEKAVTRGGYEFRQGTHGEGYYLVLLDTDTMTPMSLKQLEARIGSRSGNIFTDCVCC